MGAKTNNILNSHKSVFKKLLIPYPAQLDKRKNEISVFF